jgi:hypothetical protein
LWPFAAAGVTVVVTVASLVAVWPSSHRADPEGFARVALLMAGIAAGWIAWIWRHKSSRGSGVVSAQELERLANLLAGAVDAEWTRAAGERGLLEPEPIPVRWQRPAAPFTGPVTAAVTSMRFAPLPGLAAAGERQLQAGQVSELHEVYGGLGSGRLVIAGGPGSGKSSAAVLLILAALRHRRSVPEQVRPGVPVPVMFTLHGWDPSTRRTRDWLAERLLQAYPLFGGRQGAVAARAMVDEGRIAVILDGLDEIPEDLRPAVLRALSQQATTFRLVLLTRSAEMARAAARAVLQGAAAVELQDIDPDAAAGYLTRTQLDPPPHGWEELTSRLRHEPGSPLARALNNPLMLTLVRDTYRAGDEAGELLSLRDAAGHPASSQDIADHLLDRVLPAAYTQQPGEPPPRYDLSTAERALRCIAVRMNKDRTRDLQWWRVPAWAHAAPRAIATGLVAGLALGLALGFIFGFMWGLAAGLFSGITPGMVTGMVAGTMAWAHAAPRAITAGLAAGLVAGLVFGLAGGMVAGLTYGLTAGLAGGMVAGMVTGMVVGTMARAHAAPRTITAGLAAGLACGLACGLAVGLASGLTYGLTAGLAGGLMTGSLFGIGTGLAASLAFESGDKLPRRIAHVRWRQLFRRGPLVAGLLVGIVIGSLTGLLEHYRTGVMAWLGAGLAAALVVWLGAGLVAGMSRPETDNTSPLSPLPSRRSDQASGLVAGLVVWLGVGLAFGIASGIGTGNLARGLAFGLGSGLVAGLLVGLVYPQSWSASLAFAQLAASDRTPVRLMRFLEDARSRSVLRTVGPFYQFRHARLQDRLAAQEPATGHNPSEPRPPAGDAAAPTVEGLPARDASPGAR